MKSNATRSILKMSTGRFSKLHFVSLSLLFLLILSFASILNADAAKKTGSNIVVFTANWCASCRTVVPLAQEIGGQNGIAVANIDVDQQDAPSEASNYGLTIPSADLPQVYYVNKGHITLLFDARQYKFTKPEVIRNQILSNLQQAQTQ